MVLMTLIRQPQSPQRQPPLLLQSSQKLRQLPLLILPLQRPQIPRLPPPQTRAVRQIRPPMERCTLAKGPFMHQRKFLQRVKTNASDLEPVALPAQLPITFARSGMNCSILCLTVEIRTIPRGVEDRLKPLTVFFSSIYLLTI
jgi:hypothetical protein